MQPEPSSRFAELETPIGWLTVVVGGDGVNQVRFPGRPPGPRDGERSALREVGEQLDAYFSGELREFSLGLDLHGNELQLAVWERLREIPYGETISYGELTRCLDPSLFPRDLEDYRRVRLSGAIVGQTPTPILVPCHRVIGADGSLTGYGGGLERKRFLLELEGARAVAPSRRQDQLSLL
jgi:methylated-DNA-[protein]-cysteine S-methyltransferase